MTQKITPQLLKQDPSWLLLDIRPFEERISSELGFIPGSLSLPLTPDVSPPFPAILLQSKAVLVCASGRRSETMLQALRPQLHLPLRHLPGGVLGWKGEGLPVAGTEEIRAISHPCPPGLTLAQFPRLLASCFVGQFIESSLESTDAALADFDPLQALRSCFDAERVSWDQPDLRGLYRVIDRAAYMSRFTQTPLQRICQNLNWALSILRQFASNV